MYKATYSSIEQAVGESIGVNPHIRMGFFSTRTAYGNHWVFAVLFGLWMAGICVRGLMPYLKEWRIRIKREVIKTEGGYYEEGLPVGYDSDSYTLMRLHGIKG